MPDRTRPFHFPARLLAAFLAAGLAGCASSTMPIAPLKKGETRHGIGLQSQLGSPLNYHYNLGLTDHLDLGLQAGFPNAGARLRLHGPSGSRYHFALTNGLLGYWDGIDDDAGDHAHLRWEGRLAFIRKGTWIDFSMGPLFSVETLVPRLAPHESAEWVPRAGFSASFGGSRMGLEADWSVATDKAEWADSYSPGTEQEVAVKLTLSWGGRKPPARPASPAPSAPPAPSDPSRPPPPDPALGILPVTDPLVVYGSTHCGADPEEFSLWLARDPDRLNLTQYALDAGKSRMKKAGWSGGGGLLAFLAGGAVLVAGMVAAMDFNSDDDAYSPPKLRHHDSDINGGMLLGGFMMAGGTAYMFRGLYLTAFDSTPERALTRAWALRHSPNPPPIAFPPDPEKRETPGNPDKSKAPDIGRNRE